MKEPNEALAPEAPPGTPEANVSGPAKPEKSPLLREVRSLAVRLAVFAAVLWVLLTQVYLVTQASGNEMFPAVKDGDLVLGIRPEFLDIADSSALEGDIYGAMPTGMESTIKVRVGEFLLTGVIFGSSLFTIGAKVPLSVSGDNIMLFDRQSGRCIAFGSLSF